MTGELKTSSNAFSGLSHPRAPGGAAADYVSTSSSLPLAHQPMKMSQAVWSVSGHVI